MLNPEIEALVRAEHEQNKLRVEEFAILKAIQEGNRVARTQRNRHLASLAFNPKQIEHWFGRPDSQVKLPLKYSPPIYSSVRLTEFKAKSGIIKPHSGKSVPLLGLEVSTRGKYPGSVLLEKMFFIDGCLPIYAASVVPQNDPTESKLTGVDFASFQQVLIFTELTLLAQKALEKKGAKTQALRQDQNATGVNLVRRI